MSGAPRWLDVTAPGLVGWHLVDEDAIGGTLRMQQWVVKTTRSDKEPGLLNLTRPAWVTVEPLLDAQLPLNGSDWNLVIPHRAVDGDTHRLWRTQVTWELESERRAMRGTLTAKWQVQVIYDDPAKVPDGESCRLINLDTPEKKDTVPYRLATAEAWAWITGHADRLRCVSYYTGGGFDRLLVDLYVLGLDGVIEETLTDWMLRHGNNGQGWAPYVPAHLRKASRHG